MKRTNQILKISVLMFLTIFTCSCNVSIENIEETTIDISSKVYDTKKEETSKISPPNYSVDNIYNDYYDVFKNVKSISEYEQSELKNIDEIETFTFGKAGDNSIEWFILEKQVDKVLLISKYIVDVVPFNNRLDMKLSLEVIKDDEDITWDTSYIKHYLEKDFINKFFNENEKNVICRNELGEFVTLLTNREYFNFFGTNFDYYKAKNIYTNTYQPYWLYYIYLTEYPGYIDENGRIKEVNDISDTMVERGIRPVIYVDLINRKEIPAYEDEQ
ncbi:MAG: hypothetical protein IKI71_02120 [Lachnospiraceae bacterium]|nr:hypothetical protein [Lachnospiraceae bacterium]